MVRLRAGSDEHHTQSPLSRARAYTMEEFKKNPIVAIGGLIVVSVYFLIVWMSFLGIPWIKILMDLFR